MLHDERLIFEYLQTLGEAFASASEVCRRAAGDKRRWKENPDWAKPVLVQMVAQGILESNAWGQYRLIPEDKKKPKGRRAVAVAPHIEKILSGSGRTFDLTAFWQDHTPKKQSPEGEEPTEEQKKPE